MNTYQIFIRTTEGWAYYSKTPIFSQAFAIAESLQRKKGYEVRIRKNGRWVA